MSYDLHLFLPRSGMGLEEAARASMGEGFERKPVDADIQRQKQALARRLCQANTALYLPKPIEDATLQACSPGERPHQVWRNIELNDEEAGVQMTLFDDSLSVSICYSHRGEMATHAWQRVWEYLEIFQAQAGWRAYDPQLDKVLDLSSDLKAVLSAYGEGVGHVDGIAAREEGRTPRKPWWKFW